MPTAPANRSRRATALLVATLLLLPACGGTSSTAGPGAGGGGGGGPGSPTGSFILPVLGAAGMLGDPLDVAFRSDDDGAAVVRIVADADRNLGTTGDQVVLFTGVDADGGRTDTTITLGAPLAEGAYTLFLQIDDGENPVVEISLPLALTIYRGIAGVAPPRSNRYGVAGGVVIFSRGEAADAAGPLNGDADSADGVMVAYHVGNAQMTQTPNAPSMDVTGLGAGQARTLRAEGGTLTWLTNEADEGASLNFTNIQNPTPPFVAPDNDLLDTMVSYVVPTVSVTPRTNTYGGVAAIVGRMAGRVVLSIAEAGEEIGGTDLTIDGDALDAMIAYLDPAAAGPTFEFDQLVFFSAPLAAAAGPDFRAAGTPAAAFLISEFASAPGTDFNGDGDVLDTFLSLGDLNVPGGAGAPGNVIGIAGAQPAPFAPPSAVDPAGAFDVTFDLHAGYYLDEASHNLPPGGPAGTDLNGDAIIGYVPAFYDTLTATQTIPLGLAGPLNTAPGTFTMIYDTSRLFFTAAEGARVDPVPGTNGDADADGAILYWTDHSVPPPVFATPLVVNFGAPLTLQGLSLDIGGFVKKLAPGWLAVVVNELANGGQDINGSGNVDLALLLVETGASPMPIVHNPELVPSAAGSIPLQGLYLESPLQGDEGLVVRLSEAQNGDLDGDANGTETFLAYISFSTPTTPVLLDAGGDHMAVAGGLIGVTAQEALTGQDYDGNGSFADTLFRVLDLTGAVIEKGRPCSVHSVPATETGAVWAYLRDEFTEGRNLNGDGDTNDQVLGIWVP